jgi:hypothetical protein
LCALNWRTQGNSVVGNATSAGASSSALEEEVIVGELDVAEMRIGKLNDVGAGVAGVLSEKCIAAGVAGSPAAAPAEGRVVYELNIAEGLIVNDVGAKLNVKNVGARGHADSDG